MGPIKRWPARPSLRPRSPSRRRQFSRRTAKPARRVARRLHDRDSAGSTHRAVSAGAGHHVGSHRRHHQRAALLDVHQPAHDAVLGQEHRHTRSGSRELRPVAGHQSRGGACEPDAGQHHRVPGRASRGRRRDCRRHGDRCPSRRRSRSSGVGRGGGRIDRPLACPALHAAAASIAALPFAPIAATTPLAVATAPPAARPGPASAPAASPASGSAPAPPSPPPAGVHGLAFPYLIAAGGGPPIGFDFGAKASVGLQCAAESTGRVGRSCRGGSDAATRAQTQEQQAYKHDYADATMDYEVDPETTVARRASS